MMTQEQRNLAEENMLLAYQCAARIKRNGSAMCLDDIKQVCMLGLCYAATMFDPSYGTCFSTLAYRYMLNEYSKTIRKKQPPTISMDQCIDGTDIPFYCVLEDPFDLNHESIDSTEMKIDVESFLSTRPQLYRDVAALCMKGMSNPDIAKALGISASYVSTVLYNLRKEFGQWIRR